MEKHISELFPIITENQPDLSEQSKPIKTGALIKALNERKIRELSDVGELEKCLRYCMLLVGIRPQNLPGKEEIGILFSHINKYYSGHTLSEIRLAFEMAIAGELDLSADDVKAYENFTPVYFSQIINSYRRWSVQEHRQQQKAIDPPPPQKIFTEQEMDDTARGDAECQYQLFLKGIELKQPQFNRSILQKDKLIGDAETVKEFFERKALAGMAHIYEYYQK